MKGFIKACLIAVLIFLIVGILLLVVAAAGGVTRASLRLFSDQGRLGYGPVNIRIGNGISMDFGRDGDDFNYFNAADYQYSEGDTIVYNGNGNAMIVGPVTEISLESGAANYVIEASEDEFVYVDYNPKYCSLEWELGELSIEQIDTDGIGIHLGRNSQEVTIYIPEDSCFRSLSMEVSAGNMEVNTAVGADDIDIEVGAGNIYVNSPMNGKWIEVSVGAGNVDGNEKITASQYMYLEVNAGNLTLNDMECKGIFTAECNLGNLTVTGRVHDKVNASVDMGNLTLDLDGNGQNYTYRVDASLGNLHINDFDYSGINREIYLPGDEDAPTATLECGMGNMEVEIR